MCELLVHLAYEWSLAYSINFQLRQIGNTNPFFVKYTCVCCAGQEYQKNPSVFRVWNLLNPRLANSWKTYFTNS